jgi:hypothetical protein
VEIWLYDECLQGTGTSGQVWLIGHSRIPYRAVRVSACETWVVKGRWHPVWLSRTPKPHGL